MKPQRRPKKRLPELTAALARPASPDPPPEKDNADVSDVAGPSTESGSTENKGPGSPDPNCSICLGKLENKSFTDGCFHTFCFVCLLEWSKVKAVCPLCKQPFKSIIHNVRSIEDYDQYHIQTPEENDPYSVGARRFRYRTTVTTERWMDLQHRQHQRQMELLQRPSRTTASFNYRRYRQGATSAFRRRIYANNMRMRELGSDRGRTVRSREISAEFFRRNPACCHRLVPWLNRELNVLLCAQEDHVQFVLELIIDLIKRFEVQSEEFFEHIQPFFGRRTEHFVHEFLSFARAPFDMVKYDQLAVYSEGETQDPANVHTIEESDSENDSEVVMISDNRAPGAPRQPPQDATALQSLQPLLGQVRDFLTSMHWSTTTASGWESPTGPSSSTSSIWAFPSEVPPAAANVQVSTHEPPTEQSASNMASTASESQRSTSSHDSDVVFLQEEKPWADRTPILLSSGSDEEIEVVSTKELRRSRERTHKSSKDRKKSREEPRSKYWDSGGVCYRHDRDQCSKCTRRERRAERRKMRATDVYGVDVKSYSAHSPSGRDLASSSRQSTSQDRRKRSRSSSIEVVFEKSSRSSRHKKHKKHKHKKHKRRHESVDSTESHHSSYKKHSSGHKKSSSAPHEFYQEIEKFVRQSLPSTSAQPSTSHDRDVDSIVNIVKNLEDSIDRLEPTKDRLMAEVLFSEQEPGPSSSHLHFSSDEELDLVSLQQKPQPEDSISASSSVVTMDMETAQTSAQAEPLTNTTKELTEDVPVERNAGSN